MTNNISERLKWNRYVTRGRWNSYYNQIQGVIMSESDNILYIGKGDAIVPDILKRLGKQVTTLDVLEELEPDIVGDVCNLNPVIEQGKFDCVVCCQVLEHIKFEKFGCAIENMNNILNVGATMIISLPQAGYSCEKIDVDTPYDGKFFMFKMIRTKSEEDWIYNGVHYWEVGYRGYDKEKILNEIEKYFSIEYQGTSKQCPYHWFIRAKKKDISK